jgi:ferredoxin
MAYLITEACTGCQACVRYCPTDAISGERHEIHIIDPQRCIDCGTCGRVCPYNAVKTPAGEVANRVKRSEWLKPVIDRETCISCGLCITICPVSCLDFEYPDRRIAQEGYPKLVHKNDCIGCQFCKSICPVEAIHMIPGSAFD